MFYAISDNASDKTKCYLTVKFNCSHSLVVSSSSAAAEKPQFVEPLRDIDVLEGSLVQFTVHATGYPAPRVTWYRNGVPIQAGYSPYFEVMPAVPGGQDGGRSQRHSLRIREVFSEDAGMFKVKAENSAGSASCDAQLVVRC